MLYPAFAPRMSQAGFIRVHLAIRPICHEFSGVQRGCWLNSPATSAARRTRRYVQPKAQCRTRALAHTDTPQRSGLSVRCALSLCSESSLLPGEDYSQNIETEHMELIDW